MTESNILNSRASYEKNEKCFNNLVTGRVFTLGADSATLVWENIPAGITVTLAKAPFISAASFGFRPLLVGDILSQASSFKPNSLRIIDLPQENIGVKNIIYGSGKNTLNHNIKITGSVIIEGTAGEHINNVSTPAAIWVSIYGLDRDFNK